MPGEAVPEKDDASATSRWTRRPRSIFRDRVVAGYTNALKSIAADAAEISGLYQNPHAVEAIKAADNWKFRRGLECVHSGPGRHRQGSVALQLGADRADGGARHRGAVVKGVPGMMLGFAGGSFPVDYAMTLTDYLQDQGVDLHDYKAVDAKLREPGFLDKLENYAGRHATGVAIGDTVMGKFMASGARHDRCRPTRAAAGNVAKEVAGEMGGEALGELMAAGKIQPGQVIAEGLAAGPMAAASSTAATIARPAAPAAPAARSPYRRRRSARRRAGRRCAPRARRRRDAGHGPGGLFNTEGPRRPAEAPLKPPEFVKGKETEFSTERGGKLKGSSRSSTRTSSSRRTTRAQPERRLPEGAATARPDPRCVRAPSRAHRPEPATRLPRRVAAGLAGRADRRRLTASSSPAMPARSR
jgi:hypothetical protein